MKKFLLSALVALSSILCVSAAISSTSETSNSEAVIEYVIPNVTSGTMKLDHFHKIFDLMPDDIQAQAKAAYKDIVKNPKSEFIYGGVNVKHIHGTWSFTYGGASIVVKNASEADLLNIFSM